MKLHYGTENLNIADPFITIGSFDGVHKGHQHVIDALRNAAVAQGANATVITFDPHPRHVLNPGAAPVKLLSSMAEKVELLTKAGVEHLVILPFTQELANLSYYDFVKEFLIGKINMRGMIVGYDHRFGRNREGDFEKLKELSSEFGFYLEQGTPYSEREVNISSTKIRNALNVGDIMTAKEYLGYDYSCRGKVVKGFSNGRAIGFPTANIELDDSNKLLPGNGVYAILAECQGVRYKGMLDIGVRPTFHKNGELSVEANLFDMHDNIYGNELKLYFIAKMRDERKFDNCDELVAQLRKDQEQAELILSDY
ncbi:MAG: bifunctional riboflavin kinase/FAD synthetase [Bacteroidales bacterium]|nr:bifunctional riboflavin kinase/FAD synthetase [Bacteroidales bacterium]